MDLKSSGEIFKSPPEKWFYILISILPSWKGCTSGAWRKVKGIPIENNNSIIILSKIINIPLEKPFYPVNCFSGIKGWSGSSSSLI